MFHVHIGLHKTGSSTVQRFAAANRDLLAAAGVRYPDVGAVHHGHHLLAGWARRPVVRDDDESLAAVAALAAADPAGRYLLSSEAFEGANAVAIARLVAALRPHAVRVVAYVRDFRQLAPSRYAQRTKTGGNTDDFDVFFDALAAAGGIGAFEPVARWAQVVGWSAVRVRALDPRALGPGGLLADVLAGIGLDPALLDRCDPATLGSRNSAPHWSALETVRAVVADCGGAFSEAARSAGAGLGSRRDRKPAEVPQLLKACVRACAATGLDRKPAQYLTPAQSLLLSRRWRDDAERLAAAGVVPRLPEADAEPVPERPFLPSLAALSVEERRALAAALAEERKLRRWPDALRDAALATVAGGPPGGLGGGRAGRRAGRRRADG